MNNQYDRNRRGAGSPQNGAGGNPPAQNGYPQNGYPQNGAARNTPVRNAPAGGNAYPQNGQPYPRGQQNPGLNAPGRSAQPQQGSGTSPRGVPAGGQRSYPQNGTPQGGAYTPRGRQGSAYPSGRPASATGAAYGKNNPYASGSAAGRRQRDAMVNRQTPPAQRRERVRRVKKPFRFNWGIAVFVLLCAVVLGVSIWQVTRSGWNEDRIAAPAGPVTNAQASSGAGLPDAPEAGEQGTGDSAGTGEQEAVPDISGSTGSAGSAGGDDAGGTGLAAPDGSSAREETPPADESEVNLTLYDTVTVDNADLSRGNLVLVNASHGYSAGDAYVNQLKNAYRDRTGRLKVAATDIGLLPVAFDALERLVVDLEEDTGSHDLLITSGHRTVEEQQEIWDYYLNLNGEDYANAYVAKPGFSEHNTGLACDVSFYTDDGASIPVSEYEHGWWLSANCAREGFIRRYPEDKVDVTGIANEPWHFRYVGIPHARICSSRNWCLEEYVEGMKAYTADGVMLYVASDGTVSEVKAADGLPTSGGWLVYYVPKTAAGGVTEVRVPRGSDYDISGNNVDGFIVTVDLR